MKITYLKNGKENTIEPNKTSDNSIMKEEGFEWFNALSFIECDKNNFAQVLSVGEAIDKCEFELDECIKYNNVEWLKFFNDDLKVLKSIQKEYGNNTFLIGTEEGLAFSEMKIIKANTQEEACKEYLLNHAECKIVKIEE